MEKFLVSLDRDPRIRLACSFFSPPERSSPRDTLIVFLNGIDSSKSQWSPAIDSLLKPRRRPYSTPFLAYDRPGQGNTLSRNEDVTARLQGHGRDCLEAAHDLRELIKKVGKSRLGIDRDNIDSLGIVLVAASIGVAIARLYAAEYPETVTGCLFLNSVLASSNIVSVFPDPDAPDFRPEDLTNGITPQDLEIGRKRLGRVYHLDAPNTEGLWRGNLGILLPFSDAPPLLGPGPRTPYITVVQHDPVVNTRQMNKLLGIPKRVLDVYGEPAYTEYCEGLTRLTHPQIRKELVFAKGSGHRVYKDDPRLVASELRGILDNLSRDEGSRI
ncbi:hypothetical protein WAI453_012968 [Rhynchosporium graminicola]|uniref:AB hydrolase-1 domain-containing protein n=1 Tax=Rhynchosporium graminicola TaxID=2792576 RepID=A0A1E1L9L5_9HELO|nr:uncharacterized protein RCO7_07270 [Rhynchosporium commune]